MKQLIINEKQLQALQKQNVNESMNFFSFTMHVKDFLKKLLKNPSYAKPDEVLLQNNITSEKLLELLKKKNIIVKNEKIVNLNGKDKFIISYTIPQDTNFKTKLKRIYSELFESNIIEGTVLNECEGGVGAGATNASCGEGFVQPISKPIRRQKTIYITSSQAENIKENIENENAFGDFQYDAPPFKRKKDPAYDHNNMIKKSFNNEQ